MANYITRTLVTRNIDCSTITVNEFAKAMYSDIIEAEEKYNDLYVPEWLSMTIDGFKSHLNYVKKSAEKFAEKKWKTEKKRTAYINSKIEEARNNYDLNHWYNDLAFFDFDVNPGKNGISGNCCLSIKKLTFKTLEACFNEIKDNKYFKVAKGWKLTYTSSENSYSSSFRPQIKLIVDEETENMMIKEANDLAESIRKFYANCNYPGD